MPGFRAPILSLLLLTPASPVFAQAAAPTVELFGGYSLLPAGGDDFPRQTSHGVQGSVTVNFTHWFGLLGDIGVQFNTARDLGPGFTGLVARSTVREYFVGPRFTGRSDRMDVFAHALIGFAEGDAGEDFSGFSDSAFALGGGGGVDVRVHRRLAVRAQFDLIGSFTDIVEGNTRWGLGLVVGIGGS